MSRQYKIRTIQDIVDLTPDQREGFLVDLRAWLVLLDAVRDEPAPEGKILDTGTMLWTDDGRWGERT